MDLWAANVYRPGGFGDWFYAYAGRSTKPVLISEYGVDAFDSGWGDPSECTYPPCRRLRENAAAQATVVQRLTEQIARHAVTCIFNCEAGALVGSGGVVFTWVDEWHKGHGPPSNPENGPPETEWWYDPIAAPYGRCPDWDPYLHSPCGYALPNGLDNFFNEEWFGLFATSPSCPSPPPSPSFPAPAPGLAGGVDRLTPREGYYVLGMLWALGGCSRQSLPPSRAAAEGWYLPDAYTAYPNCEARMRQYRTDGALSPPHNTDCDYQLYVHNVEGECPPLPAHLLGLSPSEGGHVSIEPVRELLRLPPPPPCTATALPAEMALARYRVDTVAGAPRLQRVPGTAFVLLDGTPWLMRAISYSPVPLGEDPSYSEPYGDYFTDSFSGIFERDLKLLQQMGANTVRLYAWRQSTRHTQFLDAAHARGLVVIAVYEMGTAEDTPVTNGAQRALLRARLQARLRVSRHPAIVAWLVGNELNGAWNGYVCNGAYAKLFLHEPCTFGDVAIKLCALVDSLCEVVHAEGGGLCSTPLAGVSPPDRYLGDWDFRYGMHGWAQVCEGRVHAPGYEDYRGVQHVDFWAGNLYPGKNFDGFNLTGFGQVRAASTDASSAACALHARRMCGTPGMLCPAVPRYLNAPSKQPRMRGVCMLGARTHSVRALICLVVRGGIHYATGLEAATHGLRDWYRRL